MHQIRQIFQLYLSGKSLRSISRLSGASRTTIKRYLSKLNYDKEAIALLLNDSDEALQIRLEAVSGKAAASCSADDRYLTLQSLMPAYIASLQSVGVTRKLLWQEYRSIHSNGYGYTQFCEHLQRYNKQHKAVMRFDSRAGEELQVDFAGKKLSYTDEQTGQVVWCEVLICVLRHSHYLFAIALASQKQPDFMNGLSACLTHLGGVLQSIRCDNLSSAVKRSHRYEPEFTEAMDHFAQHYQTSITTARVRKPRDKASVENAVSLAYRRIYAPLRQQSFNSLQALNAAIADCVAQNNAQLFQGKDHSRRQLFVEQEQPLLLPLPATGFVLSEVCQAKVQSNYYVLLGKDKHYYSVPYTLIGKRLKIVFNLKTVEIYDNQLHRVAVHPRNTRPHAYTTCVEHMPPAHQHMHKIQQLQAPDFEQQAQQIGPAAHTLIQNMLAAGKLWAITHNICLGLLRLENKYGKHRLEAACQRALICPQITLKTVQNILQNNLDKQSITTTTNNPDVNTLPEHEHIRGPHYYQ